jgi:hypothetical protein
MTHVQHIPEATARVVGRARSSRPTEGAEKQRATDADAPLSSFKCAIRANRNTIIRGFLVAISATMFGFGQAFAHGPVDDPDLAAIRSAYGDTNPGEPDRGQTAPGQETSVPANGGYTLAPVDGGLDTSNLQNLPEPNLDAVARAALARQTIKRIEDFSGPALSGYRPSDLDARLGQSAAAIGQWITGGANAASNRDAK